MMLWPDSTSMMGKSVTFLRERFSQFSFVFDWLTATSIALIGSIAEFTSGGSVCPQGDGGVALCYISLAMLVLILLFFILGPYRRTRNNPKVTAGLTDERTLRMSAHTAKNRSAPNLDRVGDLQPAAAQPLIGCETRRRSQWQAQLTVWHSVR